MTTSIINQIGVIKEGQVFPTDITSAGLMIKTSQNIVIRDSVVRKNKLRGIGDFSSIGTKLLNLIVTENGKDGEPYNGDGILVQSANCEVGWCVISNNGNDINYEHGIYVASTARDVWLHDLLLIDNATSGVKFGGTGILENSIIAGSRLGVVFDGDQPGDVSIKDCKISATQYAIQVDANSRLARFHSDYNIYSAGSKFNNKGVTLNLAEWQKATGLDIHSVVE